MFPLRGGKWRLQFGSAKFQWCSQEIMLPNPLAPHRPLYRLTWTAGADGATQSPAPPPPDVDYGWLPVLVWTMAFALFALLPLGLFSRWGDLVIVAALLTFYGAAITALAVLWPQRHRYQCNTKQFVHLAFESLTCPPFALNLIRHLSLGRTQTADLVVAARAWQTADDWQGTRTVLSGRLQDELQWLDESTEEAIILRGSLDSLMWSDVATPSASESAKNLTNPTLSAEAIVGDLRKDDRS